MMNAEVPHMTTRRPRRSETISVRLEPDLRRRIDEIARRDRRTRSSVIELAAYEYIRRNERRVLSEATA